MKVDCIDDAYPGALDKMLSMFVSNLLLESRDLRLPAYIWAPTTAVPVGQGLAWELRAVLLPDLLGQV
jgi:hypothetical protein